MLILVLSAVSQVISATPIAWAAPPTTGVDLNAEQRALIAQLTTDKAITVARERQIAAADQENLYEQLKVKDRALREAERQAAGHAAKLSEAGKARDPIERERQTLVAALTDRDRVLAAAVRAYRAIVTGIATSPGSEETESAAAVR
jgi:hypothetical protein